ncbi:internal scaffolding protein [Microviridae sp.]|nr:internal scaffolding protein [Microviridae sp.]
MVMNVRRAKRARTSEASSRGGVFRGSPPRVSEANERGARPRNRGVRVKNKLKTEQTTNPNDIKFLDMNKNRKRVSLDLSRPKLTDASFQNSCDINVIMQNYQKTGMLPSFPEKTPEFIDCTSIPDLETAFKVSNEAMQAFYELPSDIRKLIDNDPSKLQSLLSDPKYQELLIQAGVLDVRRANNSADKTTKNTDKNSNKKPVDPLTEAANSKKENS